MDFNSILTSYVDFNREPYRLLCSKGDIAIHNIILCAFCVHNPGFLMSIPTIYKYLIPPYLMIIMHYNTLTGSVESKFLLIGDLGTNI